MIQFLKNLLLDVVIFCITTVAASGVLLEAKVKSCGGPRAAVVQKSH